MSKKSRFFVTRGMQPQPEINSYYNNNNNNNSSSNNKSKTATTKTTSNNKSKQQQSEEAAIATSQQQQQQQQQSSEQQSSRILRTTVQKQQQQQQQLPRVIKSKQPLLNFRFYLDIRDHQLTRYIEKQIQLLGGTQEFFLDANITHFVTDKEELLQTNVLNNNSSQPVTPTTPVTPQAPTTFKNVAANNKNGNTFSRVAQTRANAILSRVRIQNNSSTVAVSSPIRQNKTNNSRGDKSTAATTTYTVWQTEYAVRFFKKVQHELKSYLQPENRITNTSHRHKSGATSSGGGTDIITLKGGFIKFETVKRNCRPYYHAFRAPYLDWPKVSLQSEDGGAFALTAASKPQQQPQPFEMTRKSRSRSSQCATPLEVTIPPIRKTVVNNTTPTVTTTANNKQQCRQIKDSTDEQCGMCEICKVEYDTLTIHLKTKDHEYFARNTQNFIALDTLIQTSADVNKFLAEDVDNDMTESKVEEDEEMEEIEVEKDVQEPDPLEQTLAVNNLSPPLRERSKRSTKGKHSSEKFQDNKRNRTTKSSPTKTPPKILQITPTKNTTTSMTTTTTTRRKPNANSSSPIRPFPPPSSLYKVVETSQVENTPKRGGGVVGRMANENVTASPSLIVKIKKVRTSALLRLNGEAESFMFPKTTRRASSDLPTDVDRQSSSEGLRNSIYSSSSLDSSSISDIVVNLESPELNKTTTMTTTARKRMQCFQSTPIQPNEQLKRLRKSTVTATAQKNKVISRKIECTTIADLSPPSAAAAIVAATAKITLPAATRKSSRMATAIVSAATTSSRLLRAAAEVVKKSGRTSTRAKATVVETKAEEEEEEKEERDKIVEETKITPNSGGRRCRLAADTVTVVKMEDRMGDSSDDGNIEQEEVITEGVKKAPRSRRANKNMNLKRETTPTEESLATEIFATQFDNDDDDDYENDDDVNDDDKADKDFKYKFRKAAIKPRGRRGKRKKSQIKTKARGVAKTAKKDIKNDSDDKEAQTKGNKSPPHYDFTKSERIQAHNYTFERVPETDLWYRVFMRQDNCEEGYFQYFSSTKYHKLPYEMGPIPYTHTKCLKCKLCNPIKQQQQSETLAKTEPTIKTEQSTGIADKSMDSATPYALKHKKLHLLQRYRQEQEEALLKEKAQQEKQQNCYIKAENLANEVQSDLERRERAGSTHSTSSSCASTSTTTQQTKKFAFRNRLLQKAAMLSLELPPRKSPREHASTLALVSIIKQRQESKPNSDAEEVVNSVPTTPIPKEEPRNPTPIVTHNTRSAAATPIEEMCFATEISENVKRMRRGRNKYDHSPPYVVNNSKRLMNKKVNKTIAPTKPETVVEKEIKQEVVVEKRVIKMRRSYDMATVKYKKPRKATSHVSMLHSKNLILPPSVRKTGQKKGVLEFAVDDSAFKDWDAALEPEANVRKLEFEIDNFLKNSGNDLDIDELMLLGQNEEEKEPPCTIELLEEKAALPTNAECFINTPPATDYFSSDFDLCDLLQDAQNSKLIAEEAQKRSCESKHLSVYNTVALKKYFRKRKYMKCNRTGWPKLTKKKYSMRHQTLIANELKKNSVGAAKAVITPPDSEGDALNIKNEIVIKDVNEELSDKEKVAAEQAENKNDTNTMEEVKEHESDEEMFYDGADSIPEEEDTVLDSIMYEEELAQVETEQHSDEYEKAVEADDEDEFIDAIVDEIQHDASEKKPLDFDEVEAEYANEVVEDEEEEEEEQDNAPRAKRIRRHSCLGKALANCLNNNEKEADEEDMDMLSLIATTSTPSTNVARSSRRTPQLNGSLISCHSPSERAGDNSDIFTVSSDGLDTDLDLSNPHAHSKEEQTHNISCNSRTNSKSTKYDITKYVKNPAANTCAAEAATAAVKSLAIAQFLKKEVRVTCRRIRAPFRRFRYRR